MRKPNLGIRACGIFLFWAAAAITLPAQTFTTLHDFEGRGGGYLPFAALVQGADGSFYGTTFGGGANLYGTVFKITTSGNVTTLYNFCSRSGCADGISPRGRLVQDTDGNFYGTTAGGGANLDCCGTVFSITPGGALTTYPPGGAYPQAGLVQATNGTFYGTAIGSGGNNDGTVFSITPGGTPTTLHLFDGLDGKYPYAGLVLGTDGNFYGTTVAGGAKNDGTIFKITPSGTLTTLHSFDKTEGIPPWRGWYRALMGISMGQRTGAGQTEEVRSSE
jgi:uncharacterized repeat protein (TIGR03803 family)